VGLLLHKALEHRPDVLLVYSDQSNYQIDRMTVHRSDHSAVEESK